MKIEFDTNEYIKDLQKNPEYFHTFINRKSLAAGILSLEPGEEDTQTPHESDEIYYIIKGDGFLKVNKKDYLVSEGKVFFVAKDTEHYFFLKQFFAPHAAGKSVLFLTAVGKPIKRRGEV